MEAGQPFTIGVWTVKSGKEVAFQETWRELVKWTTAHKTLGSEGGLLLTDMDRPNRFISLISWKTIEGIAEWRMQDEHIEFFDKLKGLCEDYEVSGMRLVEIIR